MKHTETKARDAAIVQMYLSPASPSYATISKKHGVSRQRVYQILAKAGVIIGKSGNTKARRIKAPVDAAVQNVPQELQAIVGNVTRLYALRGQIDRLLSGLASA